MRSLDVFPAAKYLALLLVPQMSAVALPEPAFELRLPYSSKFVNCTYVRGLGNGPMDFDGDGREQEIGRGSVFSAPSVPEYTSFRVTPSETRTGPQLEVRTVCVVMSGSAAEAPQVGTYGFTRDGFRMVPFRLASATGLKVGFTDWVLFSSQSFRPEAGPVRLTDKFRLQAKFTNPIGARYRLMVRSGGRYLVSAAATTASEISVTGPDSVWLLHRHAEAGRNFRLQEDKASEVKLAVGDPIEGVGLLREHSGVDVAGLSSEHDLDANLTVFSFFR